MVEMSGYCNLTAKLYDGIHRLILKNTSVHGLGSMHGLGASFSMCAILRMSDSSELFGTACVMQVLCSYLACAIACWVVLFLLWFFIPMWV